MVRAFFPWPGAFTAFQGMGQTGQLKIVRAKAVQDDNEGIGNSSQYPVGTVVSFDKATAEKIAIATGEGWLVPLELQLPGKKASPMSDFLRGQRWIIGAQLGVIRDEANQTPEA